jgi:RNA polymerase sigma-70 factor (ECF subfamily)
VNDQGPIGWQSTSRAAAAIPSLTPASDGRLPTDTDLVRAFVAGDRSAFESLYDRHDGPCFDFIRRLLGRHDVALAEDLHQDTWMAVARAAASFDAGRARFVTWLFTIARNRVMDHFRRDAPVVHLAQPVDDDDDAPDAVEQVRADPSSQPERRIERGAMAQAILREVQALPLAQRETFVLFSYDELSLQEIADVTGVGLETAKSRLRYARDTLRQRLAEWRPHDV